MATILGDKKCSDMRGHAVQKKMIQRKKLSTVNNAGTLKGP